jgi:DNA-binding HxlR family transcriptional regulator
MGLGFAPGIELAPLAGTRLRELYRLLGRPHVLDILHAICQSHGPLRFVEIQRRLDLSANTLTDRLHDLVAAGLLTRSAHREIPPRVDYAPTPKARELSALFDGFTAWSRRHGLAPEG